MVVEPHEQLEQDAGAVAYGVVACALGEAFSLVVVVGNHRMELACPLEDVVGVAYILKVEHTHLVGPSLVEACALALVAAFALTLVATFALALVAGRLVIPLVGNQEEEEAFLVAEAFEFEFQGLAFK